MNTRLITVALSLAFVLLASACATPVGIEEGNPQQAYRHLTANVLSTGEPSEMTRQVLNRNNLMSLYEEDQLAALKILHERLQGQATPERLFALAELSFRYAQDYEQRQYYMTAMAYAYAFLLPEREETAVPRGDPRIRMALDLYNISIARGLREPDRQELRLGAQIYGLPIGQLELEVDESRMTWAGYRYTHFRPVGEFTVRGLRNRYRFPGVGAPLAASVEPAGHDETAAAIRKRIPPRVRVPVTAFVRFEDPLRSLLSGNMRARIEVYASDETSTVRVGRQDVPLEVEPTATLASLLEGAPIWDFDLTGFRFAGHNIFGDGLFMAQPYRRGRIPIVFVHGTASNPARWAEMLNELENDPVLRHKVQFWFYQYNTGQPVLYSASLMRSALRSAVDELDPQRTDSALRNMVIIGHSQGGLLTKLMTVQSGTRFWDNVSAVPIDELDVSEETKARLRPYLMFEPVPEVSRVIFIATPHRGSFRASGVVLGLVRRIVQLPQRILADLEPAMAEVGLQNLPNAVDNMSPNHRFVRTLADLPIDPRIKAHSIIAVPNPGPPDRQNDGVVAYSSAHITGVESEFLVRSGHSAQGHADTIEEVRRIVRQHLLEAEKAAQ